MLVPVYQHCLWLAVRDPLLLLVGDLALLHLAQAFEVFYPYVPLTSLGSKWVVFLGNCLYQCHFPS